MTVARQVATEAGTEDALVDAARAGDGQAFAALTQPYRRALHVHCYRMLGSYHDADDALQETLLRAWRGLDGYERRAPFRAWLYRIATNVSLNAIERRRLERRPSYEEIAPYLTAYPDELLAELPSPEPGSEETAEQRESIGLAFLTAVQLLPPRQRAVLILRDVLGWSARETADALGDSLASVNSALQRARARLDRERREGTYAREHVAASPGEEAAVVRRFVDAWERLDLDGIVAMLADDALMTMPPEPVRIVGPPAIVEFFATVPEQGRLDRIRLVPTRANAQPALACYVPGARGFEIYGLMVLALDGDRIAAITGYAGFPRLVAAFGLPDVLRDGA